MQYLGDFAEDSTVYIPFNTFDSNDPQASVTATNLIASDIYVHKDGSTTDIVTDGATVAIDFDTITGNHLVTIDTSASADYSVGSDYLVRIEGATVDAGTINAIIGSFSIENRFNDVNVVTVSGTAQTANDNGADINTLLTRIVGTLAAGTHNPASAAQIAVLSDWINGGRLDLILDSRMAEASINTTAGAIDNVTLVATTTTNTDMVTEPPTAAANADAVWDEPIAGHLTAGTAGLSEALGSAAIVDTTAVGTPTTTTIQLTAGSTLDDFYNDQLLYILSGTGIGQVRVVTDYTGATKTVTVDEPFITTPVATDRIAILVAHVHSISQITAEIDANSTQLAAIVADTNELQTNQGAWATATGFATEAKQDAQDLIITEARLAELDAANLPADIAAVPTVAEILTTQMTEAYAADGVAPTLAQVLFMINSTLTEFSITGTTITGYQLDGTTVASTHTLDSATTPTSRTRSS